MAVLLAALFEHNWAVRHSPRMTKWSSLASSRECIIKPLFSATVGAIQLLVILTCALNTTYNETNNRSQIIENLITLSFHLVVAALDPRYFLLRERMLELQDIGLITLTYFYL